MSDDVLFGDSGRRTERVEWALRYPSGHGLSPVGGVRPCVSEDHARATVGRREYGNHDTIVISRTVVTYTTDWEAS